MAYFKSDHITQKADRNSLLLFTLADVLFCDLSFAPVWSRSKSVFRRFAADHVDRADVKKCTTGSETSTYSVWEMKGIQSSSGEAVDIIFWGVGSVLVHWNDAVKLQFI